MDEDVDAALRFGALQLALVTAAIHLWIGWGRLYHYVQAGTPFVDPLQVLFVLSSLGVLVGVGLAAWGLRRDVVYALGVGLMLTYLLGWVFMGGHRTGGELFAPAWETVGHAHGGPLATLIDHLFANTLLLASKVTEATALAILLVLLYAELSRSADDPDRSTDGPERSTDGPERSTDSSETGGGDADEGNDPTGADVATDAERADAVSES
jgi:hypothetical protein